jgi:hypothetical protein
MAYSDESGCFTENYQSIGVVSGRAEDLGRLKRELFQILDNNKVKEIKFEKVRTHLPKIKTAREFTDKAFEYIDAHALAIDVLFWCLNDTRHNIINRDDQANLGRMYYKILRNISEKWKATNWMLVPDTGSKLNWQEVIRYLNKTTLVRRPYLLSLFEEDRYPLNFQSVIPRDSINEPLVQLADLFAGMARYSIGKNDLCKIWLREQHRSNQPGLFYDERENAISKHNSNRIGLLNQVYVEAKKRSLGVSLTTNGYLKSFKKTSPLNFWHYRPASSKDKAPTRKK